MPGQGQDQRFGPARVVRHAPEARLFVAVPLPEATCAAIEAVVARVRARVEAAEAAGGGRVRWVRMDGLHVTLRFLGGTAEQQIERLTAAVDAAAATGEPFEVTIDGAGAFPSPGRPRTLWLGIADGAPSFAEVARRLDDALAELGWPREERPFRAHLTLARTDGVRAGPAAARELTAAAAGLKSTFTADRLVLFRSHLGGGPARYEHLHEARLGAPIAGPAAEG
jgi:2'-5' RNA ligase